MDIIKPKILKGFRDFLPEQQIARQNLINIIKRTYENFGFVPLETPALEYLDILKGKYGNEGEKLIYQFRDNGGREVAMRYDLTIPLARVIAQYPEIKKPFKRYQIAPVWRAENTQKGRFREFYQCDIDIIGTRSMVADAEIVNVIYQTLVNLKIDNFIIKINNRKIIDGVYSSLKLPDDKKVQTLRIIDKIEKIGESGIIIELNNIGILKQQVDGILDFIKTKINQMNDLDSISTKYPEATEGINELKQVLKYSEILIGNKTKYKVDLSICRGLDYYTGTVFETFLKNLPNFGSIFSGGRFDNLIGLFGKSQIPAVGASIGVDRLFAALEELKLIKQQKSTAKILVTFLEKELINDYLKITKDLRDWGINTYFYFDNIQLGKQLKYAAENGINYALIFGTIEKEKGEIIVKNIFENKQETIKLNQLNNYFLENKKGSF